VKRLASLVALAALAAFAAAGCGSTAKHAAPPPPARLPRTLAQTWAQQADGVASALAAGDGCTAQQLASTLRTEVAQAVNDRVVPHAFQQQLVATVDDLPGRITCNPAPPPGKHPKHEHKHGDKGDGGGG
jgi:hypothetical protein